MNHFKKIAGVLEAHGLDAVLLTCEANRFYASGFHSSGTDGVAIVTRNRSYYFTDSRYTEAAARYVQGAEIRQTDRNIPTPPSSTRSSRRNTSPAWGMRMNI